MTALANCDDASVNHGTTACKCDGGAAGRGRAHARARDRRWCFCLPLCGLQRACMERPPPPRAHPVRAAARLERAPCWHPMEAQVVRLPYTLSLPTACLLARRVRAGSAAGAASQTLLKPWSVITSPPGTSPGKHLDGLIACSTHGERWPVAWTCWPVWSCTQIHAPGIVFGKLKRHPTASRSTLQSPKQSLWLGVFKVLVWYLHEVQPLLRNAPVLIL